MEFIVSIAEIIAAIIELLGICIILGYAVYTFIFGLLNLLKPNRTEATYTQIRQRLGRGILLGLEYLVAADIIHTVAVELTFETVGVLAIIVIIRTFLSISLDVELTGRWPWQSK